ncbi:hypothetical protein Fmac_032475 [Flemingia macrophylla]|uniref:Uncharacterized protein n=1 Tax=Flemingia macrophylla TaxID=520843 RepID=A0ABD1L521_9FABA
MSHSSDDKPFDWRLVVEEDDTKFRREEDTMFALRSINVDIVRSKSMKQQKISSDRMKTLKNFFEELLNVFDSGKSRDG